MNLGRQNGFTLIEILVGLLIATLVSTAVYSFMSFGFDSFRSNTNYTRQQEKVSEAIERIGKDIEAASEITVDRLLADPTQVVDVKLDFSDGSSSKTWEFIADSLKLKTGSYDFTIILDKIKTPESKFMYNGGDDRLILVMYPVPTNTGKFQSYNIRKPIITEYSLKYKKLNIIEIP